MDNFKILHQIAEGQYGSVYKAINRQTQEIVALKKLKDVCSFSVGISLREVLALRKLNHPNIIQLKTVFQHDDHFYIVFEFIEKNILQLSKASLTESKIRSIIFQILQGLEYLHGLGYFHRDLKPENILVYENQVKICDFGLVREIKSSPPYTEYVGTRWYRAPEILLSKPYNYQVDIFALGCIMAEFYLHKPLAAGATQLEQLQKLETILLPEPHSFELPNASPAALDLIQQMLRWDPQKRPTASQLLDHPFFTDPDLTPLPMIKKASQNAQVIRQNPFKIVKSIEAEQRKTQKRKESCEQKQQAPQQQQQIQQPPPPQRLPTLMRRFNN